jgi:hypothetical protein
MVAFNYGCCKGKGFSHSPINTFTTFTHCSVFLKKILHCSMGLEAFTSLTPFSISSLNLQSKHFNGDG